MQFDEREVRKAYSLMRDVDGLVEIRIMVGKKAYSGYFDDIETLVDTLDKANFDNANVYMTINTLNTACNSRVQKNHFELNPQTTADNDVIGYKFLMIDIDPTRPSGTSSSEEELKLAKDMGNKVYEFMRQVGFESPLRAYSGNGIHLMYRIKLKNDTEGKSLVQKCLKTLDMLFSDENCKIDTTTFNPSRISKLYGCVARKGANTEERPHRMSRIIGEYDELQVTDKKYLEKLCEYYPKEIDKPKQYNNFNPREFDLEEWMSKYGLRYRTSSYSDGTKYILDCCPFDSSHKGKDACVFRGRNGAIGFHCFHSSCADKTWQDVRIMFEPDAYEKKWQENQQIMYRNFNRNKSKVESKPIEQRENEPIFYTAMDIYKKPKVEESFIKTGTTEIDNRLRGLKKSYVSVVSGLRASGKSSWLSQLIINAVDTENNVGCYSGELSDKNFMRWLNLQAAGKSRVEKGKYEGYFNVPYKTQGKIAEWLGEHFYLYNNDYGNDFKAIAEQLEKVIEEKKLDLLILDNLMAFNIQSLNDNKWEAQTEFVWTLQRMAKKYDIHIMFVAHPRKAMGFLRLDDISGTADIGNAVDNAFIVHRNNNDFRRLSGQMFGWKEDNEVYKGTNIIEIAKDRDGGTQDIFVPLFYEMETKRLRNYDTENRIYGWDMDNDGFTDYDYGETPFD